MKQILNMLPVKCWSFCLGLIVLLMPVKVQQPSLQLTCFILYLINDFMLLYTMEATTDHIQSTLVMNDTVHYDILFHTAQQSALYF